MSTIETGRLSAEDERTLTAVRAGDETAFSALAKRYQPELQVHCYRMLGSFDDSEDLVQETYLRAWRKRDSFRGDAPFRAWLYRIATNACLDFLERNQQRAMISEVAPQSTPEGPMPPPEVPWLQPYPDRLLEQTAPRNLEPDALVVTKETIELAFLVAMQFLPPRQRAVLILREVLDWSAKETGELLDMSVAAVNSALQRARATLQERNPPERREQARAAEPDARERQLVQRYVEATERCDTKAIAELLRDDVRWSMPPEPGVWAGREEVVQAWVEGGFGSEQYRHFRCLITQANRMPAVAAYLRRPGDTIYRPLGMDVLRIENGVVVEITTFCLEPFLEAFGLPATL